VTQLQEKQVPSTDERKSATQDLQDFLASLPDGKVTSILTLGDSVVSHPDPQTTGHFRREYSTGDVVFR
jgi:hypothetical protein